MTPLRQTIALGLAVASCAILWLRPRSPAALPPLRRTTGTACPGSEHTHGIRILCQPGHPRFSPRRSAQTVRHFRARVRPARHRAIQRASASKVAHPNFAPAPPQPPPPPLPLTLVTPTFGDLRRHTAALVFFLVAKGHLFPLLAMPLFHVVPVSDWGERGGCVGCARAG